jgi:hypothetical protein
MPLKVQTSKCLERCVAAGEEGMGIYVTEKPAVFDKMRILTILFYTWSSRVLFYPDLNECYMQSQTQTLYAYNIYIYI